MIIDCDTCTMRNIACHDCVVSFLTITVGPPDGRDRPAAPDAPTGRHDASDAGQIGADERTALAVLAESGLVAPLRWQERSTG